MALINTIEGINTFVTKFWEKYQETLYLGFVPETNWDFRPTWGLNRPKHNCHMTVSFGRDAINTALKAICNGELNPNKTVIDIVGYGNNLKNEGFLVSFINKDGYKTPSNPANWLAKNGGVPHITIGVASNSTAKQTAEVQFLPFLNKFVKGWTKHPIINFNEARKGTQNFKGDTQVERQGWIPCTIEGQIMACTADGRFIKIDWNGLVNSVQSNNQTELDSVVKDIIGRKIDNIIFDIEFEISKQKEEEYSKEYPSLLEKYEADMASYLKDIKDGDKFVLKYIIDSEPDKPAEKFNNYQNAIEAFRKAKEEIDSGLYSYDNEDGDTVELIVYKNYNIIQKPVEPVKKIYYFPTKEDIGEYIKNNNVRETLRNEVSATLKIYCEKRNIEIPEFEIPENF